MPGINFLAMYRCKDPYNQNDTLLDTIAWIRQEKLEMIAMTFSTKIAGHDDFSSLSGDQVKQFDDMIRPLLIASNLQRKLMMKTPNSWDRLS